MPTILDTRAELEHVRGLADVAPEALAELARHATHHRVPAHGLVAGQGQMVPGVSFLVRGALKVVRTVPTAQGDVARVLGVMRAPCIVASASSFDGLPAEASVEALRASNVLSIDRGVVARVAAAFPPLERVFLDCFVREARRHAERADQLTAGSVEERLCRLLDGLALEFGTSLGTGRFIALPLRRKDVASMVNATTETASRLMAKLERQGQVRSTRDGIWWRGVQRKGSRDSQAPSDPASPRRGSGG